MNTRKTYGPIASVLTLMLLLSACSFQMPFQQPTATPTALLAAESINENAIIVEGRLLPNQTINLAFSTSGLIKDLNIREGGEVASGQVLASLQGAEQLAATIENAKLEVLSAQHAGRCSAETRPGKN
jgi:multidrug efflux pump subunit AcrA (membrane-fusion protein)